MWRLPISAESQWLLYNGLTGRISTNPIEGGTGTNGADLQFHLTLTANGHTTNKQFRATGRASDDDRTVTAVANSSN